LLEISRNFALHRLIRRVPEKKNNPAIAGSLLLVVILWGGNNAGTKWLVASWPPIWTGGTRFLFAGFFLLAILRFTNWLGTFEPLTPALRKQLWLRGGLSLAAYIAAFVWALRLAPASHVALCLGASPVWALLWEERPKQNWSSARRYGAALLAVAGVLVLFWPALRAAKINLPGEIMALVSSFLWANYSRQSRFLAAKLNGLEVAAHSMWMSGVWLLPFALWEIFAHGVAIDPPHLFVQSLCILFGGVVPYAFWNNALRHWRASQVLLFNNLIPLTTMLWVHFTLGEPVTPTFCAAMILIVAGVALSQMDWVKIFKTPENF
jgi:drug/metabolite transporter (DMT)-like permease